MAQPGCARCAPARDAVKKAKTDDRVEIKYYPGGVMGDEPAVLRKIKIGQLQGGAFTGGELSQIDKDAQIYSLPFLFKSARTKSTRCASTSIRC